MPLPQGGGGIDVGTASDQWTIRLDPQLGTPMSLVNRALQNAPGGSGTNAIDEIQADAAVRAVFADRSLNFRLRPGTDAMRLVRSLTRGWLRVLRYEQTYRGIPVAGAGYEANVLANGRVGSLEGRFVPDLNIEISPLLSGAQAADRARALASPGGLPPASAPGVRFEYDHGFHDNQVLVIFPLGGRYVLAWGVRVETRVREATRFYLDARDGTLLGRENVGWVENH
jgi:hypothetical protein